MSNKNSTFLKKYYYFGTTVSNVTENSRKVFLCNEVYNLTISRVISARVWAPHISIVSSSSAASFWVRT